MTLARGGRQYIYDSADRLTSANAAGGASLSYDPAGRLGALVVSGLETRFLYDGGQLAAESNASGAIIRRYVPGPGVDETLAVLDAGGVSYPLTDSRGTPMAWMDPSGALSLAQYGAFGEEGASNLGRIGFTGQMRLPEIGLDYYKARFYDPQIGRFLTPDPAGMVDGPNLYVYVRNDPINFTDPSGLRLVCDKSGRCRDTVPIVVFGPSRGSGRGAGGGAGGGVGGNCHPFTSFADDDPPSITCDRGGGGGGGGNGGTAPQGMMEEMRECDPNFVALGNTLVQAGEVANFASTGAIAIGVPATMAGALTFQPELIAPGVAMIEAGGALGVVGGGLQFVGGLAQGFGGAGFDTAIRAGAALAFGFTFGRVFATPGGYRTVSQRKMDRFVNNGTTFFGGGIDLFMGMVPSENEARCPGG